jgi:SAM-dependent methyltransferase
VSRMEALATAAGRRFARVATVAVTRWPRLWPVFRPLIGKQFDSLAPRWEQIMQPDHLAAYEAAVDAVEPPARALDLGTGTGAGAFAIARRFPEAEVVGADLSPGMIEEARRKMPSELEGRVRLDVADASRLPYADGTFELVALSNMIPFFDELARVVAAGGRVLVAFSRGADTPIYVPSERLHAELGSRGFAEFADFAVGDGTALVARKRDGA